MKSSCTMNGMKYTRRFNLGNYEHEEISVDFTVEEGASANAALAEAMAFVLTKGADGGTTKVSGASTNANDPKGSNGTDGKGSESTGGNSEAPPKAAKKEKAAPKEKKEETKVEPDSGVRASTDESKGSEKVEEKADAKVEEKPAQRKTKVIAKATKYNRNLEVHKKLMSELLDAEYKGWRVSSAKARDASVKLESEEIDFLDAEGKILDSFREALAKEME